ncbi:class I SAM-dependent methyltransferase [Chondrinema litorale]|uniref:class I SAM-dependent methyltransferase n=1 Tax=Chondrinema litorale TaxID=2994555 RepID=UPI002543DD26|nr:class I SAM-dependent methyltransferase [Chondrinema litorale]UZR98839.1 methyltransferase domain-containing protein [Chondrinema litorale]
MNEITKNFFLEIGISKGMTVLDVGCGRGITTELLAEIIGDNGKVIGIDSNKNSINSASAIAISKKQNNIKYICSDLTNLSIEAYKFDAIVGRRILVYLSDPKTIIRELSKLLKPEGIMGFQEHDSTGIINKEKMPLHYKVNNWLWSLVESNGGNINIGKELWNIFSHESMRIENIKSEAIIQTPNNNVSIAPILQNLVGVLLAKKIISEDDLNNLFDNP